MTTPRSQYDQNLILSHHIHGLTSLLISASLYTLCGVQAYKLYRTRGFRANILLLSYMHLAVADLAMCLNYIPMYIAALSSGITNSPACKASAFVIIAGIVASNFGVCAIAITTKRMMDINDRKVTVRFHLYMMAAGWLIGIALSSYFAGRDYLGNFKNMYCSTTTNGLPDIAGPVFAVFIAAVTVMTYNYYQAWQHVRRTMTVALSENSRATANADSASPRGVDKQPKRSAASTEASKTIAKFAVTGVGIYYISWFLVSLNALYDLIGWTDYSLEWDIAAGVFIKLSCMLNPVLLYRSLTRVHKQIQESVVSESARDELNALSMNGRERSINHSAQPRRRTAGESGLVRNVSPRNTYSPRPTYNQTEDAEQQKVDVLPGGADMDVAG